MGTSAKSTEIELLAELFENTTIIDMTSRHRRERKDLQAKIQELKKNAPKSDKKKRKEATEIIARLENDLEKRHAAELQATKQQIETSVIAEGKASPPPADGIIPTPAVLEKDANTPQRVSKAQKRRDKKEREERQRNDEIRASANSELLQFEPKNVEARNLQAILKDRNLMLHQVPSDGDCLYNAVRHQMIQKNLGEFSVFELRSDTADYIYANKETLICYMTHPRTGDLLTDTEFEKYCKAVRLTPAWGGEIELKALSSVLKVAIEVLQSEGPPTVHGTDEFFGPRLVITYHRHMYSLGEHYNSTVPCADVKEQNEDLLISKE